jgi:hypothetical protein
MGTKSLLDYNIYTNLYTGAKYGIYSKWLLDGGPTVDPTQNQPYEYYDYHYLRNRSELGNDYFDNTNVSAQTIMNNMASLLGNSPVFNGVGVNAAYGLIATELMKPLLGPNMMAAQNEAYHVYNNFIANNFLHGCAS